MNSSFSGPADKEWEIGQEATFLLRTKAPTDNGDRKKEKVRGGGKRERESVFVYTIPLFSLSGGGRKKGGGKDFGSVSSCEEGLFFGPPGGRSPSLPPLKPTSVARRKELGRALKGGAGRGRGGEDGRGTYVMRKSGCCLPLPSPPSHFLLPVRSFARV